MERDRSQQHHHGGSHHHHGDRGDGDSSTDLSFLEIDRDNSFDNDDDSDDDAMELEEELFLVHQHHGIDTMSSLRHHNHNSNNKPFPCPLPYLPLYIGAAIAGVILAGFLWIPPSTQDYSYYSQHSCHNNNNSAIDEEITTKFLETIDLKPQKERCIVQPGRRGCSCQNPVRASQPNEFDWNVSWQRTFQNNLQLAQQQAATAANQQDSRPLDVVLLGDSITESWHGTGLTIPKPKFAENAQVYHQLFESENNASSSPVRGLALGISGDRCTQLLYRIQHGEIQGLYPPVFWVLIGTNDFLRDSCHVDEIVAGNIRIAQEILSLVVLSSSSSSSSSSQESSQGTTATTPPAADSSVTTPTVVLQSLFPVGDPQDNGKLRNWDVYTAINQRLECYAQSTPHVEFVNLTQLFLTADNTLNTTLVPDGIHPSGAVAATMWGQAIVQKVQEILLLVNNNNNNKKNENETKELR